jgi:hypothetical protein
MKCAQCGRQHKRRRFCSNRCKDRYHNLHNPRGKFAHLAGSLDPVELDDRYPDHDEGWDGHKDSW